MNLPTEEREFARIAGQAQNLAYKGSDTIGKWCLDNGWQEPRCFDFQGTEAFVTHNDSIVLVAYRGTDDIWSALSDMDARKDYVDRGQFRHSGFHQYMIKVGPELWSEVDKRRKTGRRLLLVGHSLGAAAVKDFAWTFIREYAFARIQTHIHTFGSPRWCNAKLRDEFNTLFKNTYNWVHSADGVRHLPPAIPKYVQLLTNWKFKRLQPGGYRHDGQTGWWDTCGVPSLNPSIRTQWVDIAVSTFRHFGVKGLAAIQYHSSDDYRVLSEGL